MSLILAIRANGKAYFMADRRVLCGALVKREQNKLFVLSSKKDEGDIDIVVGICGSARFLTLIADPLNQQMVKALYGENPTIYGLVDGIMRMFKENGTEAEKDPGNPGSYNLRMVIGFGDDIYEVSRDLVIYKVPPADLAAGGSGALIANAFWAGAHGVSQCPGIYRYIIPGGTYATRDEASTVLMDDAYYRQQMQSVFDYVVRVDSGVGATTDFYSYNLQVTA